MTQDLEVKKEIRKNVTQALAFLSVTSMLDVDQISSALLQAMVSQSNLVHCHSKVRTRSAESSQYQKHFRDLTLLGHHELKHVILVTNQYYFLHATHLT